VEAYPGYDVAISRSYPSLYNEKYKRQQNMGRNR